MLRETFSFGGLLLLAGMLVLITPGSGQAQHRRGGSLPWYYGTFYSNPNYYSNFYVGPIYTPPAYSNYYTGPGYAPRSPLVMPSTSGYSGYRSLYPPSGQTYVAPASPVNPPPEAPPPQVPRPALLDVRVPQPDAQVLIDGTPMTRQGANRQYASPPLEPEKRYSYEIEVRWRENGKEVRQTRKVIVQAGQTIDVDFTKPAQP